MEIRLEPDALGALSFQDYSAKQPIEGVFVHRLRKHRAFEGAFMEFARLKEGAIEGLPVAFDAKQISISYAHPHRLNAFHVHPKVRQDELWGVVHGSAKVWLVDAREGSPTVGVKSMYVLSGEEPVLLHIPSGVAHGYQSGPDGCLLVYVMNSQFNLADPNEGRLPWDFYGADLWDEDRG